MMIAETIETGRGYVGLNTVKSCSTDGWFFDLDASIEGEQFSGQAMGMHTIPCYRLQTVITITIQYTLANTNFTSFACNSIPV